MRALPCKFVGPLMGAALLGCATGGVDQAWPTPRALGADLTAYRPPREATDTEQGADGVAAPPTRLTEPQAQALALRHNPELRARAWAVRVGEARARQAELLPNPELELEVENFGGQGALRGVDGVEASLLVSQRLETWGKQGKRVELARRETELRGWDYEAQRLDLLTQVRTRFAEALAAQERLALAQESLQLAQQVHATVQERVRAGKVAALDETRAAVALEQARLALARARLALDLARSRLAATWGSAEPRFTEVVGDFYSTADVAPERELIAELAQSPELARWPAQLAAGHALIERERAAAVPDVGVAAGVRRLQEVDDTAFVVGLSLPVPLFDRNQGEIEAARLAVVQAEEEQRAEQVRARAALTERHRLLADALGRVVALRDQILPAAERAFEAAREGFEAGKFGFLEVLDAQRTLLEARAQHIDALLSYHQARAQLERVVGQPVRTPAAPGAQPAEVADE